MYTAEQWLADLEAKARMATHGSHTQVKIAGCPHLRIGSQYMPCTGWHKDDLAYFSAANPAAVLRLVAMVRWLAEGCDCDADTCLPGCTPQCVLEKAYTTTEEPCPKN